MTLVSTVGAADQNSYVSLAEFNDFLTTKLRKPASVAGASNSTKEAALIWGTRIINTLCWTGVGVNDIQALPWPRIGMLYRTGFAVPAEVIPSDLKTATMEMAYILLVGDPVSPASAIFKGLSKIKAGSVELQFRKLEELGTLSQIPASVLAYIPTGWLCEGSDDLFVFDALSADHD